MHAANFPKEVAFHKFFFKGALIFSPTFLLEKLSPHLHFWCCLRASRAHAAPDPSLGQHRLSVFHHWPLYLLLQILDRDLLGHLGGLEAFDWFLWVSCTQTGLYI